MAASLKVARGFALPSDYIAKATAIVAKRRIGKTYNASVIAEEMVAAGLPFVVLDPTSAWWGMRASADGKRDGLPVTIIGGEYGDLPLDVGSGRALADLVIEEPGHYVIDLGHWENDSEHRRWAAPFLERIYRAKAKRRDPLHLFIDEADVFAPQKPQKGDERMLHNMQAIVRRGGIRGLGTTLITQRAAVLNKDVLTQLDLLIILRTISPQDQDAVEDYVKRGAAERRQEIMSSLASLRPGEAWIYGPGEDPPIVERVQFRQRRTFNSSATPEHGEVVAPKRMAPVDLERARLRLAEAIKKADEDDPKALRAQIRELSGQLATAQARSSEPVEVAVPFVPNETRMAMGFVRDTLAQLTEKMSAAIDELPSSANANGLPLRGDKTSVPAEPSAREEREDRGLEGSRRPASVTPPTPSVNGDVTGLRRDILVACAQMLPREPTLEQLGFLTGKSAKGGYFRNTLGALRSAGYLIDLRITDAGVEAAGSLPPPATRREVVELWRAKLPGLSLTIFDLVLESDDALTDAEIAECLDKSAGASYFRNMMGRVRGLGLVVKRGDKNYVNDQIFAGVA